MPPSADDRQRRKVKVPSRRKVPAIPKVNNLIRLRTRLVLDNDDLLTEILLRLPAKSLIRFKSVCKKWLSIISSDDFCHHHTLRRPKLQPSLLLQLCSQELLYFNPITSNGEKKMIPYSKSCQLIPGSHILQVCNGLMLLQFCDDYSHQITVYDPTTDRFVSYLRSKPSYCVYNLTTRRSRDIFLTRVEKYHCVSGVNLAFDPSKSPYYMLVCIRSTDASATATHRIDVYDLESHTWKLKLEAFPSPPYTYFSSEGTYWNNGIYWETGTCGGFCCYDISKNDMKTFPYPYSYRETLCAPHLQEWNGHLYCYVVIRETVTVWELGEDDDDDHRPRWLFKYKNVIRKCTTDKIVRLMGRLDGDGDGDEACKMLFHAAGKIWTYNFVDGTYKNPLDLQTQPCYQPKDGRFYEAIPLGETLALV